MAAQRSNGPSVRYYCTAGNGMEPFLAEEVKRKLAAEDVHQMSGKVLFSTSVSIDRVTELKAAERLFLLLKHDSPVRLSVHTNPAKAVSILQARLLGNRNQWTDAVMTWSRLQRELSDRRTHAKASSTSQTVKRTKEGGKGSEGQRKEEEKCNVVTGKPTEEQRGEESVTRRLRSVEGNGAQTVEKKRKSETSQKGETCGEAQALEKRIKRDNEDESSRDKDLWKQRTSEREQEDGDEEERRMVSFTQNVKEGIISETGLQCRGSTDAGVNVTTGINHHMESSSREIDGKAEDCAVEDMEHDKTQLDPSRIQLEMTCAVPVSFRVSCKCTGSLARYFSPQEVSKVIGVGLARSLGWKADLKNPQLEVNVYLSDDHCLMGIPLTRLPLANRSYIRTTGLRSTLAWAMASLAQIQPGFCVVDPMCGVGTILIEAAQEHKAACFLGMDVDDRQLQRASENIEFAELGCRIHLLKASSMVLPLANASVDAVICDLPFGRKFGTKTNMASNLPVIVTEMERILRVGGTLVILLSPQLSCLLKKLLAQKDTDPTSFQKTTPHNLPPPLSSLKHQANLRVSLGAIDGLIHKYVKIDA
ncbi:THUMP domain-containing protein 2 [Echeneis naucrates]|nr:THUMP domain-containing protein 2 [Echeneis naucrates]